MLKQWSKPILVIIVFLLILFSTLFYLNIGAIHPQNFPLHQQWVTKLDSPLVSLSTDGGNILLARTEERLYAFASTTGEIVWNIDLARQVSQQPALIYNGVVFIADSKNIFALNLRTGKILWKQQASTTTVEIRSVTDEYIAADVDQDIFLYDAKDGSFLWEKAVCRNDIFAYIHWPNVYVPCYGIRAINLKNGDDVWEIKKPYRIPSAAYSEGIMYYPLSEGAIAKFDLNTQTDVWESKIPGTGFVYIHGFDKVVTTVNATQLCVFRSQTGERIWCTPYSHAQSPAIIDDLLFVLNFRQNGVSAFDLSTGKVVGDLRITDIPRLTNHQSLMVSTADFLFFGCGQQVFAFSKN